MKKIAALLLIMMACLPISAQVKLAPIYTDNMVIQQNADVPIWGWATASQTITIVASWSPTDTLRVVTDSKGQWRSSIKTTAADLKPHTIKCGGVTLTNVMLGEVWLCSGQSNMEWSVNHGILNGEQEAQAAQYPEIRIYRVPRRGAETPQLSMDASWEPCAPQTMRRASAVGFFFARSLYRQLNIPIGIISSAWGGTPAEPWVPIEKFDKQALDNRMNETAPWWPIEPALLYNQMIHPFVPFTLAGAIWYQGESNRLFAAHYDRLMQSLITGWREKFGTKFPFYFVQIAPHNYNNDKDTFSAELREAQQLTASSLEKTGMIVISDLVNDVNNIHPLNKQQVGARLAAYALAEQYGKPIKDYKSPTYKSMSIKGTRVTISFHNPSAELQCLDKQIEGFTIAGENGIFVPAEAKIRGTEVEVWAKEVKSPTAVRYCFDDTTFGNLKSAAGLPVAPFRTDK